MPRSMFRIASVALLLTLISLATGIPAAQTVGETESSVAELDSFHEVIYSLWHTAYPAKDVKALRGLVEQINELAAKLYDAKLPGILRGKEAKWKTGMAELKASVDAYNLAVQGKDDEALLKAAETLHTKYERLARAIRPVVAELDAYHKILYVVYHTYLPNKKWEELKSSAPSLIDKAQSVVKAALPKRLAAKEPEYQKAAAALLAASQELAASCAQGQVPEMEKAIEKIHTCYQATAKILE